MIFTVYVYLGFDEAQNLRTNQADPKTWFLFKKKSLSHFPISLCHSAQLAMYLFFRLFCPIVHNARNIPRFQNGLSHSAQ